MPALLTIETTCDETAAAVVSDSLEVRGAVVASQDELHRRFSGVVPEIAARAHLERILPVIDTALTEAGVTLAELDAIAVATTPGLAGSLLVGLAAAKALCVATGKPLVAVNHLHAHIYACEMAARQAAPMEPAAAETDRYRVFPCVGFIVSGGHTNLYRCDSPIDFTPLGGTIDDAAGEAFDKVATLLGMPYPGGPAISAAAEKGDPRAHRFPRSFLKEDRLDFSFAGLKTAVRYAISPPTGPDPRTVELSEKQVADLAASFQQAVVDCLVGKAIQATRATNLPKLCVGGGVAANRRFRKQLTAACGKARIELHIAPPELCTDNAVMGAIAWELLASGRAAELDIDIQPGLVRVGR